MEKLVSKEQVLNFLENTETTEITKVIALYIAEHPKITFEYAVGDTFKEMGILSVIDTPKVFRYVHKAINEHPFYERNSTVDYSLNDIVSLYVVSIIKLLKNKELK